MERVRGLRWLLLLVDGLALVGVIAFSVLAAVERDQRGYVVGQIVSVVFVLAARCCCAGSTNTRWNSGQGRMAIRPYHV